MKSLYIVVAIFSVLFQSGCDTSTENDDKTDTVKPSVIINSPTTESTYSTSNSTINLSGTASDNVALNTITWHCISGCSGSGNAIGTSSWSIENINLLQGSNLVNVIASDHAGNTQSASITINYTASSTPEDTTNPSISITTPTSDTTYATSTSIINLAGTASDNIALSSVSWSCTSGCSGSGTATGTGSWFANNIHLVEGSNTVTITAIDTSDNQATDSLTITYTAASDDTINPIISISSPTTETTYTTSTSIINLAGTASDNIALSSVSWRCTSGCSGSGTASGTDSWSVNNINLVEGSNTVSITAIDSSDNQATDSLTITYTAASDDSINPLISISSPTIETTYTTSSSTINLAGTASDNIALSSVSWSCTSGCSDSGTASGTNAWSVNNIHLVEGSNSVTVTAIDSSDNQATDSLTITYTPAPVDIINPLISISSPTTEATYTTSSSTINLAGTASDNIALSSVSWSCTSGCSGSGTASGTDSWSVNNINLVEGSNTVTITALDSSDNEATDSLTITYTSTDQPPDNIPLATVLYAEPGDFQQSTDITNIWQDDQVMTYEFLPQGGISGDGAFKATPASGTEEGNTGWNIPGLTQANNSREPLFVSAVYYFSTEWAPIIGRGVKNIDFQLYDPSYPLESHTDTRMISALVDGGDMPRFDGRTGVRFELNRGGAGWHFSGRSYGTDSGLFLEDVAGMWFWLGYYIDFQNNRVSAYVKTGPDGPYPTVTRILHRTNNNLLIGQDLHDHPWVRGETITGQTSGATAIVDDYGYDGLIITPISGNFVDLYDVDHSGVEKELIVGSQSGAWSGLVAASNWNWDKTSGGLNVGASRNILGYWKVDASDPKTTDMYHIVDQVAVGNGWINPPAFPAIDSP